METDAKSCIEYWQGVRAQVKRFGELDDIGLVFGANTRGFGHKYAIYPTVEDAALLDFERRNGFELPVQYRTYLQTFGAGGGGPDYGVFDFREQVFPNLYPEAFPYSEEVWYDDVADDDPLYQYPGLAYIIDSGCGAGYLIELNGTSPGRIWGDWAEACSVRGTLIGLYEKWTAKVGAGLEHYHLLRSFIDDEGRIPKLVLQDVADKLGCDLADTWRGQTEEGGTWIYFPDTPGRALVDANQGVIKIEAGGQIS